MYANIKGVTGVPKGVPVPELTLGKITYSKDEKDIAQWAELPESIQKGITEQLDSPGRVPAGEPGRRSRGAGAGIDESSIPF